MDKLVVTMDVHHAAIDGLHAVKEDHFAVKGGAITAKDESIVKMADLFAAMRGVSEKKRVYFAVMRGHYAAMRGPNAVKRLSFAAMRVHQATMGTSNAAMEALITAKCAFIAATLQEDPHHLGPLLPIAPFLLPGRRGRTACRGLGNSPHRLRGRAVADGQDPRPQSRWAARGGSAGAGLRDANPTTYTPMLNPPLPERVWFFDIDGTANTATFHALDSGFSVKIPTTPFFGCIGVAPAGGEARNSITPGEWGGNMDASEARAGNTIYFPVNVPAALLFMGDGHAAQGDGEAAGTGIEVPLRARVQVDLLKKKSLRWPRFESDQKLMTVGAYRPLDDALRIALSELVAWIHADYGLSELDAYELRRSATPGSQNRALSVPLTRIVNWR